MDRMEKYNSIHERISIKITYMIDCCSDAITILDKDKSTYTELVLILNELYSLQKQYLKFVKDKQAFTSHTQLLIFELLSSEITISEKNKFKK